MITNFLTCLFLESHVGLGFDDLLKETWIDCINHIQEPLSTWSFCGGKLIIHVFLDLIIIFDLFNQVIHLKLIVVW